jgi:hypothetical protein
MRPSAGIPVLLGLSLVAGCEGFYQDSAHPAVTRTIGPATIQLALPAEFGAPERPVVEFDHQAHVKALDKEGCGVCHYVDMEKSLHPRLKFEQEPEDATGWMEAYHGVCITCHDDRLQKKQPTGPNDCGDCHRHRPPAVGTRVELRFDYSLHYRHVRAAGEECGACHHVYDADAKKLVYQSGAEDACNACHLRQKADKRTTLSDAAHIACINCHIERQGKVGRTGPWLCGGCHSAEGQAKIEKLDEVPRLERGQPDSMWIAAAGATTSVVGFNHLLHEAQADSCSACHHKSLGKCSGCHTLRTDPKGGGMTLEQVHHMPDSDRSCVGCHRERSILGQCAGCHHMLPQPPSQASCRFCHVGPLARRVDQQTSPFIPMTPRELPGLPQVSDDFPEEIEIKVLAGKYRPSKFPHKKIVAALDAGVRANRLAARFHNETAVLCAGCHHHSPPGERVPSCRSCHSDAAHPLKDLPDLTAAYHRQCIGCHQAIGHPATGCTDCHEEVQK